MKPVVTDKVKFLGCEILYREACKLASSSPFRVDLEFVRKGLHDLETSEMVSRLQAAVDTASSDGDYKAILLGYARCNDGVVGLRARSVPLVIPKAHDCITFFFGSRSAYRQYFDEHPGTYFHTTGWLERGDSKISDTQGVMSKLGLDQSYEELVRKYGAENADFIRDTLGGGLANYTRICYLEMGAANEKEFIEASRKVAGERGWEFDLRKGDWSLLERLFNGEWDNDDFLIVPPGHHIQARNDADVVGESA